MSNRTKPMDPREALLQAVQKIKELRAENEELHARATEPIAVVGIGCRYPGGVQDPESFWQLLVEGVDAIREVPKERWDIDAYYDPDPDAAGKMTTRWGGFLESLDRFDAAFFGISPREAVSIDPQQRLLLETSWEALERARIVPERLFGSNTGVYVGLCGNDYQNLAMSQIDQIDAYSGLGTAHSATVGRLSYWLGLKGPNIAIDTACSSSLVAVHLACQALHNGECSLALAGGVNLVLSPEGTVYFSRLRAMSPTGRCHTFSDDADGYVRSEGCGMVVLKRLSDAQRDGDPIVAVIRGSAVNQDGRSNGLTAPNGPSQEAVIRQALEQGGVTPAEVGYVETHGTGTPLGDPIEVQALGAVLGEGRSPDFPVVLGAVKSNIGHTEGAAGIAGMIKAALCVQRGLIPKNLHFESPNRHIPWSELKVAVASEAKEWGRKDGRPRIAGASSFGFSGTNAHVVLGEAPSAEPGAGAEARPAELVVLTAQSEAALKAQAGRLREHVQAHPEQTLADLAHSLVMTRSAMEYRLALVTGSLAALAADLGQASEGGTSAAAVRGRVADRRGKRAFLFTGQGAQGCGMGRGLYAAWPAFREGFDRCTAEFDRELGHSLREVMWAEPESAAGRLLDQTEYTQPALFALEYALYGLWRSWGVSAEYVAGHSIGELVAACVAGVFSLADGARLCAARGRLMQALPRGGAMVSIGASEAEVALAVAPHASEVSIAAVNGPEQVVIAGEGGAVRRIAGEFSSRGARTKELVVSHAFHSPLMEPMLKEFRAVAETVRYQRPTVELVSNVSGKLHGEELCSAEYWVRHVREAVRFGDGVRTLHEAGVRTFIEIGPRATLLGLVPGCVGEGEVELVPSLRGDRAEAEAVLGAVGGLYVRGGAIDWKGVLAPGARRVELPTYAFDRQRYWLGNSTRRAVPGGDRIGDWFYEVEWPEVPRASDEGAATVSGRWLIMSDRGGVGEALAAALSTRGQVCTVLAATGEASAAAEHLGESQPLRGVVYLGGLDAEVDASSSAPEVEERTLAATAPVLQLVQGLARRGESAHLWIVTRGACAVDTAGSAAPCQSALWGLGRVVGLEHPSLWGGLVDLDPAGSASEVEALVRELLWPDAEAELCLRQGRRHGARLVSASVPALPRPLALSSEGSYLVTGGLGGLGLEVARWLVGHGARHLVLTGRRGAATPGATEAVASLQAQGAEVRVAAVDVADGGAMAELLSKQTPPVRGVVHAAGVGPSQPIVGSDVNDLSATLSAKVRGSWVLHSLLKQQPLDLFVLFSSGASVWGGAGQGAYAAANGFMDGLAHHRRGQSLAGQSINWGVWAGGGMGDAAAQAQLGEIGVLAMPTESALSALERVVAGGRAQVVVTRMDWGRFAPVYGAQRRRQLLAGLVPQETATASSDAGAAARSWRGMSESKARSRMQVMVRGTVAEVLGFVEVSALDPVRGFAEQGMDSLMAVQLRNRLQQDLGIQLSSTLAFDYPTVDKLVAYLLGQVLPQSAGEAQPKAQTAVIDEAVAIVGAACRFPGGVEDLESYWQLLADAIVATSEVPASRWNVADWYDPDPEQVGRTYVARAGFLREVEGFDAAFFRISPREALTLDPQQRLLLEVSWEALERAGQDPTMLRESPTGVFVGVGPCEYSERLESLSHEAGGLYAATGNMPSVLSGRLSFFLGLHGPSMAVDTACSSSLVALHLGCQSLRQGECERALVGGVNLLLSPAGFVMLSRMRALAPDGRCKTFSAEADGYARAEGCAVVVLKRLGDAQRDGDRILAVIRGTAVNHDGASSGLTVPNGPAQQAVIEQALEQARVSPAEVDYVECHGTGTALGDPIEVQALSTVYGRGRAEALPLVLGAAKANLGHLEAASGLVGLLKVVLAFLHEQIPPQPELGAMNPHIPWVTLPVRVARQSTSWPRGDRPRLAGLSAFGMSGTNVHVVLQEAPLTSGVCARPESLDPVASVALMALSAKSETALNAQAGRLAEHLQRYPELSLQDVAYSLLVTRSAMEHRLTIPVASREGLLSALADAAQGQTPPGAARGRVEAGSSPQVVFIFPGQGSQWLGMGQMLLAEHPVFREVMVACDRAILAEAGFSLLAELAADEAHSQLHRIDVVQPLLFAMAVGLAALWRSWGIEPAAVVGHSMGEVAAAHVAGALSLEDAVAIICRRSRLLRRISGQGEMAMVELSLAEAQTALAGYEDRLSVAVSNSLRSTVVAGDRAALAELLSQLEGKGIFCRRVKVDVASHSPQVDPLQAELLTALATITPRAAVLPMHSTVTGSLLQGPELVADYWVRNLRQPVRFAQGVQALIASEHRLFVEMSPHPILVPAVQELLDSTERGGAAVGSLRRGQRESITLRSALGALWVNGLRLSAAKLCPAGAARTSLPTYPWQRERYWVDAGKRRTAPIGPAGRWPLSGVGLRMPGAVLHHLLLTGIQHQPYLADHVVFGKVVVPGAFHMAVILSIATEQWPERAIELSGVEFLRAITLEPGQEVELHAVLTPESDGPSYQFELATLTPADSEPQWTTHARGRVQVTESKPGTGPRPEALESRTTQPVERAAPLQAMSAVQINWGPRWQWLQEGRVGNGAALASLEPTYPGAHEEGPLHPTLLDNSFGVSLLGALLAVQGGTPQLPFAVERLRWWQSPVGKVLCGSVERSRTHETSSADFTLVDEDGGVIVEVEGFAVRRAPRELFLRRDTRAQADCFYRLLWQPLPPPDLSAPPPEGSWLVVAASGAPAAAALSARLAGSLCVEPAGLAAALEGISAATNVVCLWETDTDESPPVGAQRVANEALTVLRALLGRAATRLWWVTTAAVAVKENEPLRLETSTIWGLGRTVMQEHPEFGCTLVDLPADALPIDLLLREFSARDDENQIAWRDGHRHGARLLRLPAGAQPPSAPLSAPGTVLVTGGLGALGKQVARWLAQQGVAHLVLTGRRGLDTPGAADAVAELQALGARVTVAALDVADRVALQSVLAAVPGELPLRGVVHAAVVLDDGVLSEQTPERFAKVLLPKVAGAWNLHELVAGHDLDFFVLFSSAVGLLGAAGQSNYAAANTFLDALASYRRALGLKAQSLAWGAWSEVGQAAALQATHRARLSRQGMKWLSPEDGIALFARALSLPEPHLGVLKLDSKALAHSLGGAIPPLWRLIVRPSSMRSASSQEGSWAARLATLSAERREAEVRSMLQAEVARVLAIGSASAVPINQPFSELGLDSLMAMELRNSLGRRVGKSLSATLAFDYPTVDALARWLLQSVLGRTAAGASSANASPRSAASEPIAIIGMGLRYPGGVSDPASFWKLLHGGVDAIGEIPRTRWDVDELYDPDPSVAGKMMTRWGGFLSDIDQFDPSFFGISPREAEKMDPQQRLLLETSWEALERAGVIPDRLMESDTGVFVGLMYHEYGTLLSGTEAMDGYVSTGNAGSIASGRISYFLGLKGPSLTVDTACSSSLVALHLACQSLQQGECSVALAGGVTVMLTPMLFVEFSRLRGLAPDGRCKSFSEAADGAGWSEGCGMLVLKRLSEAVRDGDPIHAVIRGSAVNQDGRSNGLTAPNGPSQEALIQRALQQAGVAAREVGYVECHGTGTKLGDPIEAQALGAALSEGHSAEEPVRIGSVKSNLGHTQAAAGVAGIIKTVLALEQERIPKSLHAETLSRHIPWSELPLKVVREEEAWPRSGRRRIAGVSSFGISGTNAHVILEEAPVAGRVSQAPERAAELVVVSAKSEAALKEQAARLRAHLQGNAEESLGDVAYSLASTRSEFEHRLGIVARTREGLQAQLELAARGEIPAGVARGTVAASPGKLAFLFTPQGAQTPGMGRDLYAAWPAFRHAFDRCMTLFDRELERPLREVMWGEPGSVEAELLDQTKYTQPALFALAYALHALWRSWGVIPDLVAGHSAGELVAACVAGVFALEDAVRLCAARGRLMQALPRGGAMRAIAASEAMVAAVVAAQSEVVSIAAVNGPESVVISGVEGAVSAIGEWFAARGVRSKGLQVSHASHSPLMEPMLEPYRQVAESLRYERPSVALVSNLSGQVSGEEVSCADYWVRHVRESVRFVAGVQALYEAGARTFVELGPRPTLLGLLPTCLPQAKPTLLPSLREGRPETESILEALGGLWAVGHSVDWHALFPAGGQRVDLPRYAWQRQRYWIAAPTTGAEGLQPRSPTRGHPLLGLPQTLSTQLNTKWWETTLDRKHLPWLGDHQVQGAIVFPGAAYLEMAQSSGIEALSKDPIAITDVVFSEAMVLSGDTTLSVQTVMTEEQPGLLRFQVASRIGGAANGAFVVHARGKVQRSQRGAEPARLDLADLRARLEADDVADAYARLRSMGLEYGPAFQGILELWRGPGEALGRLQLPQAAGSQTAYQFHPALLDACFQVVAGAFAGMAELTPWVPVELGSLRLLQPPPSELFCYVRSTLAGAESSDRRCVNLRVVNGAGAAVAEIHGLILRRLATGSARREEDGWFLGIDWELARVPPPKLVSGRWLLLGDGRGVGAALRFQLQAAGHTVVQVSESRLSPGRLRTILSDSFAGAAPTAVVHLGSLSAAGTLDEGSLEAGLADGYDSVLCTVQAVAGMGYRDAPRLWLLTRGAQAVGTGEVSVVQAPLLGLARVVAMEHAELRCGRIDLDPGSPAGETQSIVSELLADDSEDEIALRGGERRVARIVNRLPEVGLRERSEPASGRSFRLEIEKPGVLDHLVLRAMERRAPGPGEVEIAVDAAGLNFIDVMKAMGIYPGLGEGQIALGGECAGRVVNVGEGVQSLRVGQAVVAVAPFSFGTHVTVVEQMVVPRPDPLSAPQAAAIPVVFMTAWYGLVHLARLRAGERVLIHSAAGGTGLAAVAIARHLGAEVFATAGTPEKRAWLREQGIRYVMDSRSLDFAEQTLAATGGEGVDVVLNSLSGQAIEASLSSLAVDGRFIEIGKTDIYKDRPLGLAHFKKSLSYSAVDLVGLGARRPERFAALLREVMQLFVDGSLQPLAVETFPISRAADAFRKMAQAQHIAKLVLTLPDPEARILVPSESQVAIRADGTYLVTGGLGGLGLSVAGWLAEQGAGELVLLGRSGITTDEQKAAVAALVAKGARVRVAKVDVARRAELQPILQEIAASGRPLRGVIHAAGLLDDGILLKQSPARLRAVMAPKAQGALHLHELTSDQRLDFFVLYASGSGLLGSPGQGNYAAANSFLDALAHYRKRQGLPALSVDWGAFAEVGLAAAQANRGARLSSLGMRNLSPIEGLRALGRLLESKEVQAGVMPLNLRRWVGTYQAAAASARLSRLLATQSAGSSQLPGELGLRERLATEEAGGRAALLQEIVRTQAAQVLRISPDKLDVEMPLTSLGMDSLMGLELRNRLETVLGINVPATLLWSYPTVAALGNHLAGTTQLAPREDSSLAPMDVSDSSEVEDMSQDDLARMITEKFEALK